MKLNEFRLETYSERSVLATALLIYRERYPDDYQTEVQALLARLSATQCQPGGCDICGDDNDH